MPADLKLEDQLYSLLKPQNHSSSEEGYFKTTSLDFSQFGQALGLYCEMSQQPGGRSKKTSSLHLKTALKLKNKLATLSGTQEKKEEALYKILILLQQNKRVKAYGLDTAESDLYLLFTRYRNYYYSQLIEKTTPAALRESLHAIEIENDKSQKLTGAERALVKQLKARLEAFITEPTSYATERETYFGATYLKLNQKRAAGNEINRDEEKEVQEGQDQSCNRAYEHIRKALKEGVVRNIDLQGVLSRYKAWYELQSSRYSFTQSERLKQQVKRIGELEKNLLTLTAQSQAEITAEKQARRAAETQSRELEEKLGLETTYLNSVIHNQQSEKNQLTQQITQLLETNEAVAQELREKTEELIYTEKKLTTGSKPQQTNVDRIEVLEKDKENAEETLKSAKKSVITLTQELERQQKENQELKERIKTFALQNNGLTTENIQLASEKKQLQTALSTLMAILHPLLEFFGLKRATDSLPLKKKLGEDRAEQLDYLMLADVLKNECETHLKKDDSFPTKPPIDTALPLFKKVVEADKKVCDKLFKTHAPHLRHLIMKLAGKALELSQESNLCKIEKRETLKNLESILKTLGDLRAKSGEKNIQLLNLPQYKTLRANIEIHIRKNIHDVSVLNRLEKLIDDCVYVFGGRETLGTARTQVRAAEVEPSYSRFFKEAAQRPLPPTPTTQLEAKRDEVKTGRTATKVEEAIDFVRTGMTA